MSDFKRAKELNRAYQFYSLMDPRARRNLRRRVQRLARKIDPMLPETDARIVMILDHISLRTGINPRWKRKAD